MESGDLLEEPLGALSGSKFALGRRKDNGREWGFEAGVIIAKGFAEK